jgi:uncharacterized MAPEG superfamily protein
VGYAKFFGGRFNNFKPRIYVEGLKDQYQRAYWAHLNSNEAIPLFIGAMIMANMSINSGAVDSQSVHLWGAAFLIVRMFYGLFYIFNKAPMRSIAWFMGLIICCRLMLI